MPCPTTAEFADYLSGGDTHRSHILDCLRCSALASALRFVSGTDDLDSLIAEVDRREAAAVAAVAELESRPSHQWGAHARADERLHSPEGVRRLLDRAAANEGVTPRRALALSQLAVTCAVIGVVAPALIFSALKEYAIYSLQVADDLDSAFRTLDAAEAFVPLTDDPEISAAILAHARAFIYGDSTCAQWHRALSLLDECEPVFEKRDPLRCHRIRHFRAAVLVRRCDYDHAAELFKELLDSATDAVSEAYLRKDLAECYCRMGRPADALPLVTDALTALTECGHGEVVARAKWTRGVALSGVGDHDEAVRTLESVSRFFATAGLNDDELGAELSLIQATLARNPAADVAPRLEQAFILACALDASQPLRTSARRAAVWGELLSAFERKKLTPAILTHASEYLRTLGRGDEAPFPPLQ